MDHREFSSHVGAVDMLARHGLDVPREWLAVRQRMTDFMALDRPATERLAAAVVSGNGDLVGLRADALAEEASNSVTQAAVGNVVSDAVFTRLRALWAPHAAKAYKSVAREFDSLVAEFIAAARAVDPEAPSDTVLRLGEPSRQAWFRAAELAEQLDALLPTLCAAAELVPGAPSGIAKLTEVSDGLRLSLVCDPGKSHRRRVWEAFNTTGGRCGRWSAWRRLDIQLRTHPAPAKLQPYEQPKPLLLKWEPGRGGGYVKKITDPEDDPKAALPQSDWSIA